MQKTLLILFVLFLVPLTSIAYADTIQIKIPPGSSDPSSTIHFIPSEISVRPGDKVEWGNTDTVVHTVTSGSLYVGPSELFDSGHLKTGSKFYHTFTDDELGEQLYFCTIHPWMFGIVNVVYLPKDFHVIHNVGSEVSYFPIDVAYKVQRNLVTAEVEPAKNMLTFTFAGKADNDNFVVRLDEKLIQNPQSVWLDDQQTTSYELKSLNGVVELSVMLNDSTEQVKIVGTSVIGKAVPEKHVLINQIFGVTDKKSYIIGDDIIVSGEIKNPVQLNQISIELVGPQGNTVYHKNVPLANSTKFTESISTPGTLRDFGEYVVKITGPDAKNLFLRIDYGLEHKVILTPLKQMKGGVDASDVICNKGLELLMKNSAGSAACVSESTAKILLKRGWGDYF